MEGGVTTHGAAAVTDGAEHDDRCMANGTRVAVHNAGFGVGTIDGFRHNVFGANNHSMVFDGCVLCDQSGGCGVCRKSLQLKGTAWKILLQDGEIHGDTEMPKGTRVVVEDAAYGLATIDGFRANVAGANNHSMVFDNCQTCPAGSGGCGACRKSLQLRGKRWKMLNVDGSVHNDTQLPTGTRVAVENFGYGLATIDGFRANVVGANNHSMVFDNCQTCPAGSGGCGACRKSLKLKGTPWRVVWQDGIGRGDHEMAAGTRIVVEDAAYGLATIDGFRANMVGANNHSMVFDNCQTCPAGSGGCGACRKSLQLRGTRWKYWKRVNVDGTAPDAVELQLQDGSMHDDTELPKGTRVAVFDHGYGMATVVGFQGALIGANAHDIIYDNCLHCTAVLAAGGSRGGDASAGQPQQSGEAEQQQRVSCDVCRRRVQLSKNISWKVLGEDAPTDDGPMARGTRVAVYEQGYGLATIDGFRANVVGANNHSMVFDGCVLCDQSGGCGVCRKSLRLKGTAWKLLKVDGSVHDDTEMPKGSRIVVEDAAYGLATIDGFRANMVGANNHSMVFDNCQTCPAGSGGCGACRKSLQLRGTRWKILMKDGASHDDQAMGAGTRVLVEDAAYGVATICGFSSALFGSNTHEVIFDNCPACAHHSKKEGCTLCRKALQLKGIEWSKLDRSQQAQEARKNPRWVKDDEQQVCMLCDAEFGVMTRQHHCRYCGWLVCSTCSPDEQSLGVDRWVSSSEGHPIKFAEAAAGAPTKHKRVCNSCLRTAPREIEERRVAATFADEGVPPDSA